MGGDFAKVPIWGKRSVTDLKSDFPIHEISLIKITQLSIITWCLVHIKGTVGTVIISN